MSKHERCLQLLLRVIGASGILAIVAVVMPYSWMDAIHQWLGMGKLPSDPIVGYLARSTSAFYAIFGGLLWLVSYDLRRHRAVLLYLGVVAIVFGLALLVIDLAEGLPLWWSLSEGPFNVVFGVVILWLRARSEAADGPATEHSQEEETRVPR